jgi:hypothetical protein
MRLIKTYLLRLYTDTDAAARICGDIRPLDKDQSYSFKNFEELVFRLRQWMSEPAPTTPPKDSGDRKDYSI